MIVTDQQRFDCIGYSGAYPVRTPHIDRLAAEGLWFENAYTPIPVCCPARQALLNGRRPEAFGALWNYNIALEIPALPPDAYSWVRDLQATGYHTSFMGKWSGNPQYGPRHYGFDDVIGLDEYTQFRKQKYPDAIYQGDWRGETDPVPFVDNVSNWLAERCIEQIQKCTVENAPWHLRLDFPGPHLPCCPSAEFAGLYEAEEIPIWRNFEETFQNKPYIQRQQLLNWGVEDFSWRDWSAVVARYYGMVTEIDCAIGRVLHTLDQLKTADNTLVIYTADHGDMCGGHRMVDKHYVLYEDVVKVPLVMRWPQRIAGGARTAAFVSHFLDLPPTLLEIVGVEVPDFFHGHSLVPLMAEPVLDGWRQEVVSTYNGQQFGLYTQRMIRDSRWKYIWNTTDVDELYDLQADPGELVNRIHDKTNGDVVAGLRRRLYETLLREGDAW